MQARSDIEDLGDARLHSMLSEEIQCAENLLAVLGREQRCLSERDIEGITSIASEKARLVTKMEQLDGHRLGLTPCPLDPRDFPVTDSLDTREAEALSNLRRKLRDLLHRCHTQNQINGHAIAAITKHVERTVQILQGVSGTPSVYGADGEALTLTASRYVTRA